MVGGGGNELETLLNGTRLVAWMRDVPSGYGLDGLKRGRDYLVFKPENRDVAELLDSVPNGSPVSDLLNGLAFGYGYANTIPCQSDRAFGSAIESWLKDNFNIEIDGSFRRHRSMAVVNADLDDIKNLKRVLNSAGIKAQTLNSPYNLAFSIPSNLKSDLAMQPIGIGRASKKA